MLRLFKTLLFFVFLLSCALAALVYFALESKPLVTVNSSLQVNEAESVKELMRQMSDSLKNRSVSQDIELSEAQLNSLVGFAQRAHKQFSGKAEISDTQASISATYVLPPNFIGRYFNLNLIILPAKGIDLEHVKVGAIALPGSWALSIATTLADWYTSSDIATQFMQQVENVSIHEKQLVIRVRPIDVFLKELNTVKQGLSRTGDEELILRTAFYLKYLTQLDASQKTRAQSLAQFMGPVFKKAQERSSFETAYKENEAAIMALATYAGHYRFANFVGDVQPVTGKLAMPTVKPVLAKREDLNQHFIFSAAIKILSEQGLSIAIGEFKELMDRGQGGSGYSFVDLSADYAGVKFAQTATDPEKARQFQNLMAGNTNENTFFPSIKGLPEGLSKKEFMAKFKQVDSPEYQALVNEIHQRVDALPLHQ